MDESLPHGVTAWDSAIWQTRSVLVRCPAGVVLFDPTYFPREVEAIARAAEDAADAIGGDRVLVFTHSDWDHVVGFPRFSGWRTVAHHAVADKTDEQRRTITAEIEDFDARWYVDRPRNPRNPRNPGNPRPPRNPHLPYPRIDQTIAGEERAALAGEEVLFIPTPGHTDDGIATVFPARRLIVAGDVLSALEFPFVCHSVSAYRRTLATLAERVRELDITCLIPGHGPAATSRREIEDRLANDRDYLDRLADRVAVCIARGLRGESLQQELASFAYRGQPIGRHQADFHLANVVIAEREQLAPA